MNKPSVMMRASYLQLRKHLWIFLIIIAVNTLVSVIVSLSMGKGENTHVSIANIFTLLLVVVGTVLPGNFFKRMINLGATRKEYYVGILCVYSLLAAAFAVINIVWFQVEIGIIHLYEQTFNILEIFHWNQFGLVGMFIYQFGAYLLVLSLFTLLISGSRHVVGWVIWVFLIAAIPIFTSIAPLRAILTDGLLILLFNDSLLQGFGLTFVISCICLYGGWWFTKKRTLS
ncbi:hypothetical protein NV379_16370 [Paenibacillus sp. N1-5-1-14]|uniref:hypothetical protein n=1 Tax=Paenibacillus radicibacter TaxID=2972488 RepID=UPI002158CDED|nr:hypothetical protein [Paenibacillus radicibacter]MCR8644230.1 hypothetical protein [Paenibacillus radicibacter]